MTDQHALQWKRIATARAAILPYVPTEVLTHDIVMHLRVLGQEAEVDQVSGEYDVHVIQGDELRVEALRRKLHQLFVRPQFLSHTVCIVVVPQSGLPENAQTIFLKAIEDGPEYAKFFFIVPFGATLLPTIVSRSITLDSWVSSDLQIMQAKQPANDDMIAWWEVFLARTPAQRKDIVQERLPAWKDRAVFARDLETLQQVCRAQQQPARLQQVEKLRIFCNTMTQVPLIIDSLLFL